MMEKDGVGAVLGGFTVEGIERVRDWAGIGEELEDRLEKVIELSEDEYVQRGEDTRFVPISDAHTEEEGGVIVAGNTILIIPVEDKGSGITIVKEYDVEAETILFTTVIDALVIVLGTAVSVTLPVILGNEFRVICSVILGVVSMDGGACILNKDREKFEFIGYVAGNVVSCAIVIILPETDGVNILPVPTTLEYKNDTPEGRVSTNTSFWSTISDKTTSNLMPTY